MTWLVPRVGLHRIRSIASNPTELRRIGPSGFQRRVIIRGMSFREQGIHPADGCTRDGFVIRPLVLGCIYLLPNDDRMYRTAEVTSLDGTDFSSVDATVAFWVRDDTAMLPAATPV